MTQVESAKEEGGNSSQCQQQQQLDSSGSSSSGESGPASHNEQAPSHSKKIDDSTFTVNRGPIVGNFCVNRRPGGGTFTTQRHFQPPPALITNPKLIKLYRNGDSFDPFELECRPDLKHARSWEQVLKLLSSAIVMSPRTKEEIEVKYVFTVHGRKVCSLADLELCNQVVVSENDDFIQVQYGAAPVVEQPNHRRNRTYKIRRDRNAVVKSVLFEAPLPESEEELSCSVVSVNTESSQPSSRPPLVKTLSEQDVSNYEVRSTVSESPKLRPRSNHSPRPRPMSAVASVHGSPMTGLVSRIPKRIVSSPNNNSRGSSPNVCTPTSVQTPNSDSTAISNNNVLNRNSSRRIPISKPKITATPKSERPSRHDTAAKREFIRPRLVTIIRHGMKPRKAVRFLLNQKTARNYDQVLTDITESIKPDWGAVRKVFTLNGEEVDTLAAFFGTEDIFLACANDRINPEDFELDFEECKAIQPYVKAPLVHKHSRTMRGLDSKSPQRKSGKGGSSQTPPFSAPPQPAANAPFDEPTTNDPNHPKNIPISHLPAPILNKYIVGGIIGDGNFAVVRECLDKKTEVHYALKIIDKSKCNGRDVPPEHEIAILTNISHPNIITLFEQYDFSNELYVVMELVDGGDLFDEIAHVTKFSEKDSKVVANDVASALHYLHVRKIAHRDIKPENLLVYYEPDGQRRVKLGDFGLAQFVTGPMYTVCGTPTYVAPEILAETGYGFKVDIWALGVIVYVLLSGYPPFVSPTGEQEDLFDCILAGDFEFHADQWKLVSEDAKDMIQRMIDSDVDTRLTAKEVLDHPWLARTVEEREQRRLMMIQRDFRLNVFEAMGLSGLGIANANASLP